jgi:hypothetical protein
MNMHTNLPPIPCNVEVKALAGHSPRLYFAIENKVLATVM